MLYTALLKQFSIKARYIFLFIEKYTALLSPFSLHFPRFRVIF